MTISASGFHRFPKASHGEIVNERGRTVFEVGFARAIHEALGD